MRELVVQRQRMRLNRVGDLSQPILRLARERFSEYAGLLTGQRFDGQFRAIPGAQAGNHRFSLSIAWDNTLPIERPAETRDATTRANPTNHLIVMRIRGQRVLPRGANPASVLPGIIAETLGHELVHAQFIIDRVRAAPDRSAGFGDFQNFLAQAVRSPARSQVIALLTHLARTLGLLTDPAQPYDPQRGFERLVEERYATRLAAQRSGTTARTNADIASTYGTSEADRIWAVRRTAGDRNDFDARVSDLVHALTSVFDTINPPRP